MFGSLRIVAAVVSFMFLVSVGIVPLPVEAENPTVGSYDWWKSAIILEGKAGSERNIGTFQAKVPLQVSSRQLIFADARFRAADEHRIQRESHEYNLGFGIRQATADRNMVWGLYGYFDQQRSAFRNRFQQGTFGGELLFERFELRGNAYFTESTEETIATGFSEPFVVGNDLLIEQDDFVETPLDGWDAELGVNVGPGEVPLWLYGGYFRFDESGFPKVDGPRIRAESHFRTDVISEGSRLTFGATWQDDDFRDEQLFGTVRLRIPFGGPASGEVPRAEREDPHWTQMRMAKRTQRDVDVVTATTTQTDEVKPLNPETRESIEGIFFAHPEGEEGAEATQDEPTSLEDAMARMDQQSVVVAMGEDQEEFEIGESEAGTTRMLGSGEVLLGGESTMVLQSPQGDPLPFTAPGERPTVVGAPDSSERFFEIREGASNVLVQGIDMDGSGEWNHAITGEDIEDVRIVDNTLSEFEDAAVHLSVTGASSTMVGNVFENNVEQVRDKAGALDFNQVLADNTFDNAVTVREGNPDFREPVIFSSIQDGIDVAQTEDLVAVEGGLYEESVTVETPGITIFGANEPEPIVMGQSTNTVRIGADDVEIAGLEIRNPEGAGDGTGDINAVGIRVDEKATGVTIQGNTITHIGTEANTNARGIQAFTGVHDLEVLNNEITNLAGTDADDGQVEGIQVIEEAGGEGDVTSIDNVLIQDNVIRNVRDTRSSVGIRFSGNISGDILDNEISELNTDGPEGTGFTQAISLAEGGNATRSPQEVTIHGNQITNLETDEVQNWAAPVGIILNASDVDISENTISDFGQGGLEEVLPLSTAVLVEETANVETIQANQNNLLTEIGLISEAGKELDVTENWWGDEQGPDHADNPATTDGSLAFGNIRFHPWLDDRFEEDPGLTSAVVLTNNDDFFLSIQDGIDAAGSGQTVEVREGQFKEDVIIDVDGLTLQRMGENRPEIDGSVLFGDPSGGSEDSADGATLFGFHLLGDEPDLDEPERGIGITESDDVVIEDNVISGFLTQISMDFSGDEPTNVTIHDNRFQDGGVAVGSTEDVDGLTLTENEFENVFNAISLGQGVENVDIVDNEFDNIANRHIGNFDVDLNLDIETILETNEFDVASGIDEIVEEDALEQAVFPTIQDSVDLAREGATVLVVDGIYEESMDVPGGVTLQGPNAGIPGTSDQRGAEAIIEGSIEFTGDNTIDGFMLRHDGTGVLSYGTTSVSGDDLAVVNNIIEPEEGTHGINLQSGIDELIVQDNLIEGGLTGTLIAGDEVTARFDGNVFDDKVAGIFVADGQTDEATLSVENNDFLDSMFGVLLDEDEEEILEVEFDVFETNSFQATEVTEAYVSDREERNVGDISLQDILEQNDFDPEGESTNNQIVPEDE